MSWLALARANPLFSLEHVGMDRERHLGPQSDTSEQGVERLRGHRPTTLGGEHMRGGVLFPAAAAGGPVSRPLEEKLNYVGHGGKR